MRGWGGEERWGGEWEREVVVVVVQTVEATRVSVRARTCGATNSGQVPGVCATHPPAVYRAVKTISLPELLKHLQVNLWWKESAKSHAV